MASYLRPRRGKRATARTTLSGTNVLKKGEIFFECDNGPGGGQGRIMMGDGSSNYSALTTKYFLDFDSAKVAFTNVTASNSSSAATPIGTILPTNTLATCLNGIKQSLLNLQGAVTALNNDKVPKAWKTYSTGLSVTLGNADGFEITTIISNNDTIKNATEVIIVIDDSKGARVPKEYFIGKRPGGHGDTIQGRSADGYFCQVGFFINEYGAIKGGYSQGGWNLAAPKVTAVYYR